MNSKFIGSQTNLNPIEMDRPDYRYGFTDLGINFQSSVGNKYFPHGMFTGNANVPGGQTNQPPNRKKIPLSLAGNEGRHIRKTDGGDVLIAEDGTYVLKIFCQFIYPSGHDNNDIKNVLLGLKWNIDGSIVPMQLGKRSAINPDSYDYVEIVSLEKGNKLSIELAHTFYGETAAGHGTISIVKLS